MNLRSTRAMTLALVTLLAAANARAADDAHAMHHGAAAAISSPHFAGLGPHTRKITTSSAEAQSYFDQGLNLIWAFNLQEAQRSFEQAAKLDPACAMCRWGVAMSLGPHINVPAVPERTVAAEHAVREAVAREPQASEVERAMIDALTRRYADPAPSDPAAQAALDQGYADAMREVAKRWPDDLDVQALCVEALLDLRPWDYWTPDGRPQPGTEEIISRLEQILAKDAQHPGANHYYIHVMEASPHPEKALAAARRMESLMPAAGHMVHMPFHIYLRTGNYAEAEAANQHAVAADLAYAKQVEVPDFMHMYIAHDYASLSFTQVIQGKSEAALENARAVNDWIPIEMAGVMPGLDFCFTTEDFVLARFGRWDPILAEPAPTSALPYVSGIHHYVRGLALAARKRYAEAGAELDSVIAITETVTPDYPEDMNSAKALLTIAKHALAGDLAAKQGRTNPGIAALELAAAEEDSLRYSEPPDWPNYIRLTLGDVLIDAKRFADAEAVYNASLRQHPSDPWALRGLCRCADLGHEEHAGELQKQFKQAWKQADVKLERSRF